MIEGGYGIDECQALLSTFTADGTVDYFSLDVGNNWGEVSYIPPAAYPEAAVGRRCAARPSGPPTYPSCTSGACCARRPPSRCWPTAMPTWSGSPARSSPTPPS